MLNFDPVLLSPFFQFRDYSVVVGPTVNVPVLPQNLSRVYVGFYVPSGSGFLRPLMPAASNVGFGTASVGTVREFMFATHGIIVGQAWNCWSSVGINPLYILEAVYVPPGD